VKTIGPVRSHRQCLPVPVPATSGRPGRGPGRVRGPPPRSAEAGQREGDGPQSPSGSVPPGVGTV